MPSVEILRQADFILSKCGRPIPPQGLSVIYLYRGIPIQDVLATGSRDNVSREISGDTVFELRALSITTTSTTALYLQIQLPNGRQLINNLQDITQIAGYGSTRYLFTEPLECPAGSKATITFDDTIPNAGAAQPVMVLLEGADKYYLKGGKLSPCLDILASSQDRYAQDVNQNILAPCWMQGFYPEPPVHCQEEIFTYNSVADVTISVTATNLTGTSEIKIDRDNDFEVRRLLVYVFADATVTGGSFLGKVRAGSGYLLTDDYLDLYKYLGSAPFVKGWTVKRGDSIFVDLELVDVSGTGNINFRLYAEGLRRKAA